ncbi:nitroreductase [Paracoccus sp. S-4012]|uniref:nitroreductase family protein n=1 Tax=Paracoccus sp. S-4012 TaxID=2665648 RepID=UPI0012B15ED9|nr:nitroreductase [Paracoccus sp. S-4012]MRX49359.1 nitroreductase [Paracoccus sp. S-4012]
MPARSPAVLDFLATRRSVPPRMLSAPGPEGEALDRLLHIALRVPDHGKLEPWRLIVLDRAALDRLKPHVAEATRARGDDQAGVDKATAALDSPVIVAVVASPGATDRIPAHEQTLSAGNVCLTLLQAALADGWGAGWLTGIVAGEDFARAHLGLGPQEWVAGLIHIGTAPANPVPDRPRPDPAAKITRL